MSEYFNPVKVVKINHLALVLSFWFPFTDDQCTVRVTNVSEDTQEGDLRDLFQHFGSIRRVFLAKDKITQHSKVSLVFLNCCSLSLCLFFRDLLSSVML